MAKENKPRTPAEDERRAVEPGELWGDAEVQTARDIERPREAAEDAAVVPGFTTTSVTGSQGGRAVHGLVADEEDA